MSECTHQNGFYLKMVSRYRQYYDENGRATGTVDDVRSKSSGGILAYCENCDKRIGRVSYNGHLAKVISDNK